MANITNNTVRLIHMGANMLIPGMTTTVPDEYLTNARVKALMDSGSLTSAAPPPPLRQESKPAEAVRQPPPMPARALTPSETKR